MSWFNNISSVLLAFIIGFVQLLPVQWDDDKPFYQLGLIKWINEHSIIIIAICCGLIIAITIVCAIVAKIKGRKKWLTSVLQEIIDNYLCGQNCHTRVTVFKVNCRKTYLKCYARFGYPQNLCPKPHKIPIAQQYGDYIGVVGKCLAEGKDEECHAEDLGNIKLNKKFENNVPQNREKIKEYMAATYISDYKILRAMHRRSTNFYAYPIIDKNANIWGVLIIDNDESKKFDFKKVKLVMKAYSDLIALTLNL